MSFTLDVSNWVAKANGNVDRAVRYVLISLSKNIIMRNPVGDAIYWKSRAPKGYVGGRSRANWQYGNNDAPNGILNATDKTGASTISRLTSQINSAPTAAVHWFTNNLDYIQALENGHSRQAPNGMVKITIMEFQRYVRDSVGK